VRVVCAGHVNRDVTLRLDRLPGPDEEARVEAERRGGGGSAANVATALVRLDAAATLLGSVGDDEAGRRLRADLAATGVDCDGLVTADGATASKHVLVDGEGRVATLGRPGANEAYDADDLPASALAAADGLHLTGQDPETAAALADRAAAADVPVSVDPGRRTGARDDAPALARADLVFLNEAEAERLLGGDPPVDGLPAPFAADETTVVVTRGAAGATALTPGGRVDHPGYETAARDPTGAGDAFAAGYLLGRSLAGGDGRARTRAALAVGNACGALAAGRAGARLDADRAAVRALAGDDAPPDF
jgi:ribokinase